MTLLESTEFSQAYQKKKKKNTPYNSVLEKRIQKQVTDT